MKLGKNIKYVDVKPHKALSPFGKMTQDELDDKIKKFSNNIRNKMNGIVVSKTKNGYSIKRYRFFQNMETKEYDMLGRLLNETGSRGRYQFERYYVMEDLKEDSKRAETGKIPEPMYYKEMVYDGKTEVMISKGRNDYTISSMQNNTKHGLTEVYTVPSVSDGDTTSPNPDVPHIGNAYLSKTLEYDNGVMNGTEERFYASGQRRFLGKIDTRQSLMTHLENSFSERVPLSERNRYKRWITPDGETILVALKQEKFYDGKVQEFYPDASLKSSTIYQDGDILETTTYDSDGSVLWSEAHKGDVSKYIYKDEQGIMRSETADSDHILIKSILPNGKRQVLSKNVDKEAVVVSAQKEVLKDGFYKLDEGEKDIEYYVKNGQLIQKAEYFAQTPIRVIKFDSKGRGRAVPIEEIVENISRKRQRSGTCIMMPCIKGMEEKGLKDILKKSSFPPIKDNKKGSKQSRDLGMFYKFKNTIGR